VPDVHSLAGQVDVVALQGGELVQAQPEVGGGDERVVQAVLVGGVNVVQRGPEVGGGAEPFRGAFPLHGDASVRRGVDVQVAVSDGPVQAGLEDAQVCVDGGRGDGDVSPLRRASGLAARAVVHWLMSAGRMSPIGVVPSSIRRVRPLRESVQVSSGQIPTRIIAS
jgi:hypothetical protein